MAITSDLNLHDKNDNNWVSLKSKRLVNKRTQKRAENVGQNHVKFNNCMKFMLQTSIKLFLLALKANYFISLPFELPPKNPTEKIEKSLQATYETSYCNAM